MTIQPGGNCELFLNFTPSINAQSIPEVSARFTTNDPDQPEHLVVFRISKLIGGLTMAPSAITLGTRFVGEVCKFECVASDTAAWRRKCIRVEPSDPKRLRCHFVSDDSQTGDVLQGEVVCTTEGYLDETIAAYFEGLPRPIVIPVTGVIKSRVEVVPSKILLPRRTESGPLYDAVVHVISHVSGTQHLEFENPPAGFEIRQSTPANEKRFVVTITLREACSAEYCGKTIFLRGKVITETGECPIAIGCTIPTERK